MGRAARNAPLVTRRSEHAARNTRAAWDAPVWNLPAGHRASRSRAPTRSRTRRSPAGPRQPSPGPRDIPHLAHTPDVLPWPDLVGHRRLARGTLPHLTPVPPHSWLLAPPVGSWPSRHPSIRFLLAPHDHLNLLPRSTLLDRVVATSSAPFGTRPPNEPLITHHTAASLETRRTDCATRTTPLGNAPFRKLRSERAVLDSSAKTLPALPTAHVPRRVVAKLPPTPPHSRLLPPPVGSWPSRLRTARQAVSSVSSAMLSIVLSSELAVPSPVM